MHAEDRGLFEFLLAESLDDFRYGRTLILTCHDQLLHDPNVERMEAAVG
jgi:hypothetical protein